MSVKKPGLGKNVTNLGLKELLSDFNSNNNANKLQVNSNLQKLPIEFLHPGKYQPRHTVNQASLEELASSIRNQGLLQPIIVRHKADKEYEIIAGERRWRAAQLAGLTEVPIILRDLKDKDALAISLVENIQREDLNAIDEAEALDRLSKEFSMTHQEVANVVGKSRTTVTNLLRLLELQPLVRELVAKEEIEMGHARALLSLSVTEQARAAKTIVAKGLSVRETERLVTNLQNKKSSSPTMQRDPNIAKLETNLSEKLGAKVTIQQISKSKGRIVINYNSLDELDGILEHIK
jgi:ParB family transcriptional regulator, chromosome partitioning protein